MPAYKIPCMYTIKRSATGTTPNKTKRLNIQRGGGLLSMFRGKRSKSVNKQIKSLYDVEYHFRTNGFFYSTHYISKALVRVDDKCLVVQRLKNAKHEQTVTLVLDFNQLLQTSNKSITSTNLSEKIPIEKQTSDCIKLFCAT